MNRRLWRTVGLAVAGMVGLSFALTSSNPVARAKSLGNAGLAVLEYGASLLSWPVIGAIAGVAVLLGLGIVFRRKHRDVRAGHAEPWRTVIEMGRAGGSASTIAQATGLPQDAVRIILAPVSVEQSLPRGKSFRGAEPSESEPAARRRPHGYA